MIPDAVAKLVERFWTKVNKNGPVPKSRPDLGPCWLWTAETNRYGYGLFRLRDGTRRARMAHTFIYEVSKGPLPDGLVSDHLCRVRNCVRCSHLEPVTHKENVLRGIGITAVNAKKTHCLRGHPLTEDNLWRPPGRNERWCKICMRIRRNRDQRKRRATELANR